MVELKKTWMSNTSPSREFSTEEEAEQYERCWHLANQHLTGVGFSFKETVDVLRVLERKGLLKTEATRTHKIREFSEPWVQWDNARALQEGWDLMELEGRWTIQKIDDPSEVEGLNYTEPKFLSDTRAVMHVCEQAMFGSHYHFVALDLMTTLVE
jgi:hypothetical protein